MTTREDRIDTLLSAAVLLIDTAIDQIDIVGVTLQVQDGLSALRVARDLVEQARFFPEDAKVQIPNEPSLKGGVGGSFGLSAGASVPNLVSGTGGSQHLYGAACDVAAPPVEVGAGGNVTFSAGPGSAGGAFSVPESPRRRELREKYRVHGWDDWPGRPRMHGGQGDYCSTCEGVCLLELLRLGEKL